MCDVIKYVILNRESCGVCGFLSPENTEEQTMGTNSYSNIEDSSFDCGR